MIFYEFGFVKVPFEAVKSMAICKLSCTPPLMYCKNVGYFMYLKLVMNNFPTSLLDLSLTIRLGVPFCSINY